MPSVLGIAVHSHHGAGPHPGKRTTMLITNQAELTAHLKAGQERRTDALLAYAALFPAKEWSWLHGVLCMAHGQQRDDDALLGTMFDGQRIAERMDDLNRKAVEEYTAAKAQR